ncbi:hypothetical protein [Halobacillus sp. H74]|uniref:hypothetical protein n=1 Tax=Halobacillus sp. H74 TaxID=3457436 RepID=UPI003FCC5EAD
MRIERLLVHSCTLITPGVVTGQDPYGRDIYEENVERNVPCRVDQIRQHTSRDEYGTDFVIQHVIFIGKNQPVNNDTRFKDFVDDNGNQIINGVYEVEQIAPMYKRRTINHYEITLKEGSSNG